MKKTKSIGFFDFIIYVFYKIKNSLFREIIKNKNKKNKQILNKY